MGVARALDDLLHADALCDPCLRMAREWESEEQGQTNQERRRELEKGTSRMNAVGHRLLGKNPQSALSECAGPENHMRRCCDNAKSEVCGAPHTCHPPAPRRWPGAIP